MSSEFDQSKYADAVVRLGPARVREIESMMSAIAPAIAEFVRDALKPLTDRLLQLEAKAIESESRGIRFEGTHQRALVYRRGSVVVADGSSWVSLEDGNGDTPGTSGRWALMAKRGKDGAHAR
jgi:hypothetical protein